MNALSVHWILSYNEDDLITIISQVASVVSVK